MNFAIIGAAGYIAQRHLKAIKDTGNTLIAAVDPHDSVGLLDKFGFDVEFFTHTEEFELYLRACDYVSVCSPNDLHYAHISLALRAGANVICEKPLVLDPELIPKLYEQEQRYDRRVYTVLQLRLLPGIQALKQKLDQEPGKKHKVKLQYVTPRGSWYDRSWKGDGKRSGGVITNIGIHLFDLLLWLFGPVNDYDLLFNGERASSGHLDLERASVDWFLSVNASDLPEGKTSYRAMKIDDETLEFSEGFTELHTQVYAAILAGNGLGIEVARPSVQLAYDLRSGVR